MPFKLSITNLRAEIRFMCEEPGFKLWPEQLQWAGIAQSVQRLATGCTVRKSYLGVDEIFRTRPDQPWGPPCFL